MKTEIKTVSTTTKVHLASDFKIMILDPNLYWFSLKFPESPLFHVHPLCHQTQSQIQLTLSQSPSPLHVWVGCCTPDKPLRETIRVENEQICLTWMMSSGVNHSFHSNAKGWVELWIDLAQLRTLHLNINKQQHNLFGPLNLGKVYLILYFRIAGEGLT